MTDRLTELEATVAELRGQLAALQTLVDRNDDFANGLWRALLHLLIQMRAHQPMVIDGLRESWVATLERYDELCRSGEKPDPDLDGSLEGLQAVALLARFVWTTPSPERPVASDGRATRQRPRPSGAENWRAR